MSSIASYRTRSASVVVICVGDTPAPRKPVAARASRAAGAVEGGGGDERGGVGGGGGGVARRFELRQDEAVDRVGGPRGVLDRGRGRGFERAVRPVVAVLVGDREWLLRSVRPFDQRLVV